MPEPTRSDAPGATFPTICAAPFTTLHFDPRGNVRSCCENKLHILGNVSQHRIVDLFTSAASARLRDAVRAGDTSLGCGGCADAITSGQRGLARVGIYDHETVSDTSPTHPVRLELELSNSCNLQCIMCDGELSSAIRLHREGLPPIPPAYGDDFFDQLAELAPTLSHVAFLGGEPFLASESLRAMDVLATSGFSGRCHVTTNGTIATPRVERLLDRLEIDLSISIDGLTAATLESIRIGVHHDRLVANIDWFAQRVRARGNTLNFHYCVMTSNWQELHAFLRWADGLGVRTYLLPVLHPRHLALDALDRDALAHVVETLRSTDPDGSELSINQFAWTEYLDQLERNAARSKPTPVTLIVGSDLDVSRQSASRAAPNATSALPDRQPDHVLVVDPHERLLTIEPDPASFLGHDGSGCVGQSARRLLTWLNDRLGPLQASAEQRLADGRELRSMTFADCTLTVQMSQPDEDGAARWSMWVDDRPRN